MEKLSRYFFHGLIVVLPIAVTSFIIIAVIEFSEMLIGRRLPFHFPGIGLIAAIIIILIVGWLSSHWLLKRLIGYGREAAQFDPGGKIHLR